MPHCRFRVVASFALFTCLCGSSAGQVSSADTGAPEVRVSHSAGKWSIAGKKNTVVLDEANLAVTVNVGAVAWRMVASSPKDLLIGKEGDEFDLRLAGAKDIRITLT